MISSFKLHESIGRVATTFLNYSSFRTTQEAVRLRRMIERVSAKQKAPNSNKLLLEKGALSSAYANEGSKMRVIVLNRVYMEHLTLMLNNGECGRRLGDLGIEISKIQLAGGLNFLHLYWITRNPDIPENVINETLKGALAELQQQMGTLRFTSKVPLLRFVKDLRLERELYLDKIFETADYGKDFQPTHGKKVVTPDFVLDPGKFPEMRQNVLGLDHAAIKNRIEADISRHKSINFDETKDECAKDKHESPQKLIVFNRKEFHKYYNRKRILELKLRKKFAQTQADEYDYPETYTNIFADMDEQEDEYEYECEDEDEDEDEYEFEHKYNKKEC